MKRLYTLIIEILIAIIFGIIGGALFVLGYKGKLPTQGVGSLADWISAIMSFIAILVVFWQVKRESQNQRAFYIENKRPRFSVERTTVINLDEKILYHNNYVNLKTLYKKLHDKEQPRYIIRLTNISDNIVHSLKIVLRYGANKSNRYAFSGLNSKQSILLVPDEEVKNGINPIVLWIDFETAANETGYFHFKVDLAGSFTEYTFVKEDEPIAVYGDDVLVNKKSRKAEKLKKKFRNKEYSYRVVTISPEEFRTMKK